MKLKKSRFKAYRLTSRYFNRVQKSAVLLCWVPLILVRRLIKRKLLDDNPIYLGIRVICDSMIVNPTHRPLLMCVKSDDIVLGYWRSYVRDALQMQTFGTSSCTWLYLLHYKFILILFWIDDCRWNWLLVECQGMHTVPLWNVGSCFFLGRPMEYPKEASNWFLLCGVFFNGFFENLDGDIRIAHWAFLGVDLLCALKPLHKAFVVEDVSTWGHFTNFRAVAEGFHADNALRDAELIDFFVVLAILHDRD